MSTKTNWVLSVAFLYAGFSGVSVAVENTETFNEGKKLYQKHCVACHQADGKGMTGVFPPLAGSDYLMADKQRAISIPLKGLQGEITVNGQKYNGVMPNLSYLKDQEVASIMTYVMNAWGNEGELVTAEEVAQVRGK